MIQFTKMQGTGNDFVVINCLTQNIQNREALAARLCERRFGIGADQMILLDESSSADYRMEIYNPDGSQVEMCGNALRAIALFIHDKGLSAKETHSIDTIGGLVQTHYVDGLIMIDMGEPNMSVAAIGLTDGEQYLDKTLNVTRDLAVEITTVSMGNPHAVIFVDDVETCPLEEVGPLVENHPLFANRTNVEFIQQIDENTINMRVWERGTGETLACGSGACASVVASILNEKTTRDVTVKLRGGDLQISWDQEDNHVRMKGPAVIVFDGTVSE